MKKSLHRLIKWLLPGMGIKRWLLVVSLGVLICSGGLSLLATNKIFLSVEIHLQSFLSDCCHLSLSSEIIDIIACLGGLLITLGGSFKLFSLLSYNRYGSNKPIVEQLYEKRKLDQGLKLVAIGGGTGLSSLLRGLKHYTSNITAIVSVSDNGGSSGRLSKDFGILPPGDIRHCMTALADDESLLSELFDYRFQEGEDLKGHSFGNLFLLAMTDLCQSFSESLRKSSQILAIRGRVLPATLTPNTLFAKMRDGRTIEGESQIPEAKGKIVDVYLKPSNCQATEEVIGAIKQADAIILGPGSLYTSVIPPLLVKDIAEAVKDSNAPRIYVCNAMTQPGETDDYTAADHLQSINHHVNGKIADYIIVNMETPKSLRKKYEESGSIPIKVDSDRLRSMDVEVIEVNLVKEATSIRHDPDFLAETIMDILDEFYHHDSSERSIVI